MAAKKKTDDDKKPKGPLTPAQRAQACAATASRINRREKAPIIMPASEVPSSFHLRRPTGIMELDIHLGGGWPASGLSVVAGPNNAGKSYLVYRTMAMNQRLRGHHSNVALFAIEHLPDYFLMRRAGLDVAIPPNVIEEESKARQLIGLPGLTKEERKSMASQTGRVDIVRCANAEMVYDTLLELIDTNGYDIIGVDSMNALLSKSEESTEVKGFEKEGRRAGAAGVMTRFFQHYYPRTLGLEGKNDTTLLFTGQVRQNEDKSKAKPHIAQYMKDWAFNAPNSIKHAMLICLTIWGSSKLRAAGKTTTNDKGEKETEAGPVIGKKWNWELIKGKMGTHDGLKGDDEFYYDEDSTEKMERGGIDITSSVLNSALRLGVISEVDGKINIIGANEGPMVYEGKELTGLDGLGAVASLLESELGFDVLLRQTILFRAGISCHYL